jgi:putative membrane protein
MIRNAPVIALWLVFLTGALNSFSHLFDQLSGWTAGPMLAVVSIVAIALHLANSSRKRDAALWITGTGVIGWLAEVIGVNSGLIFGHYQYSDRLGPMLYGTPFLIGLAWILVALLGSAVASLFCNDKMTRTLVTPAVMTAFDAVMEPAAVRLGLWQWRDGEIPLGNYVGWYLVGLLVVFCAETLKILPGRERNVLLHLFFAQLVFFFVVGWL